MPKLILVLLFAALAATAHSQKIRIVENSRFAKWVGRMNGEKEKYAITIGRTIFLSCKTDVFLAESWWVKHEFEHVEQYRKYGIVRFFKRYLYYTIRYGYYDNPFESKAVAAEFADDPQPHGDAGRNTALIQAAGESGTK